MLDVEKKRQERKSNLMSKMHILRAAYTEKHYQETDHESGHQSPALS